jgi:hypothetical protein
MSVRKLCFFMVLATIIAFVAPERLNAHLKGFDVLTPNSRSHDPSFVPEGALWYMGSPTNRLGRSNWLKARLKLSLYLS